MRMSNNVINGSVLLEDYIPLKFVSDENNASLDYARYSKGDKSLLEFAFDKNTRQLYRLLLVLCDDFSINDYCFSIPEISESGGLLFDDSFDGECSIFHCEVFKDAITIKISENSLNKRVISNNILWEIDDKHELISVTLFNLSYKEIEHTITELQYAHDLS